MKSRSQGLFVLAASIFVLILLLVTNPSITGFAVQSIETYDLDFSQANYEYEVNVIDGSTLNLMFSDKTYHLTVEKVSNPILIISGANIPIGESVIYDINEDGIEDIIVQLKEIDGKVASIKVSTPEKFNIWELAVNFWWLILLVIVLVVAVVLFYKAEFFRTKHAGTILKHLQRGHDEGVINESLYNKARRAIKRKLKP